MRGLYMRCHALFAHWLISHAQCQHGAHVLRHILLLRAGCADRQRRCCQRSGGVTARPACARAVCAGRRRDGRPRQRGQPVEPGAPGGGAVRALRAQAAAVSRMRASFMWVVLAMRRCVRDGCEAPVCVLYVGGTSYEALRARRQPSWTCLLWYASGVPSACCAAAGAGAGARPL